MLLRLSALRRAPKLPQIITKRYPHFSLNLCMIILLQAFNTNTLNFHQYFKDKLSSHKPSDMHNRRHRTDSYFNTPLFYHSQTQKCYLYQLSNHHMEQPTKFA